MGRVWMENDRLLTGGKLDERPRGYNPRSGQDRDEMLIQTCARHRDQGFDGIIRK